MRCEFSARGVALSSDLQAHLERRIWFGVGRFSARIVRVSVHLDDVNGPRSGVDKRCRIVARLSRRGELIAEAVDTSWEAAVQCAADRLARAVARAFDRRREQVVTGHQASAAAVAHLADM